MDIIINIDLAQLRKKEQVTPGSKVAYFIMFYIIFGGEDVNRIKRLIKDEEWSGFGFLNSVLPEVCMHAA